jgi:hypothetical protein
LAENDEVPAIDYRCADDRFELSAPGVKILNHRETEVRNGMKG